MTDEIKQAFEHPETRAEATVGSDFHDRISLRDHLAEVEIGAFQVERGNTQRLSFDVVVEVRDASADLDDNVDGILSYDTLTEAIAYELAHERLNLLETLAERVAMRILQQPQAMRVFVRIQKLDRGPGALGVEIVRSRQQDAGPSNDATPLHPLVVYMENAAISGPKLAAWIDRFEQHAPVVLCVGLPDVAMLQTGDATAQRHVDLLQIEQNAWLLASLEPRCAVVGSRTELDWAMKQGNLSVWAPSRLVLDAVDGPQNAADGVALAQWLGQVLRAERVVVVGDAAQEINIPTFAIDAPESFV